MKQLFNQLPGVSLSLFRRVLSPKLYFGVVSNFTFSGEYAPGAKHFIVISIYLTNYVFYE